MVVITTMSPGGKLCDDSDVASFTILAVGVSSIVVGGRNVGCFKPQDGDKVDLLAVGLLLMGGRGERVGTSVVIVGTLVGSSVKRAGVGKMVLGRGVNCGVGRVGWRVGRVGRVGARVGDGTEGRIVVGGKVGARFKHPIHVPCWRCNTRSKSIQMVQQSYANGPRV